MNKLQFTLPKQTTFNFGSKVNHALVGTPPVAASTIKFSAATRPQVADSTLQARAPEPTPRTSGRAFGFGKK